MVLEPIRSCSPIPILPSSSSTVAMVTASCQPFTGAQLQEMSSRRAQQLNQSPSVCLHVVVGGGTMLWANVILNTQLWSISIQPGLQPAWKNEFICTSGSWSGIQGPSGEREAYPGIHDLFLCLVTVVEINYFQCFSIDDWELLALNRIDVIQNLIWGVHLWDSLLKKLYIVGWTKSY